MEIGWLYLANGSIMVVMDKVDMDSHDQGLVWYSSPSTGWFCLDYGRAGK